MKPGTEARLMDRGVHLFGLLILVACLTAGCATCQRGSPGEQTSAGQHEDDFWNWLGDFLVRDFMTDGVGNPRYH